MPRSQCPLHVVFSESPSFKPADHSTPVGPTLSVQHLQTCQRWQQTVASIRLYRRAAPHCYLECGFFQVRVNSILKFQTIIASFLQPRVTHWFGQGHVSGNCRFAMCVCALGARNSFLKTQSPAPQSNKSHSLNLETLWGMEC